MTQVLNSKMLKLFPLDITVIFASKLNKKGLDTLCQIHPELSNNSEFWDRMYKSNIRSSVPNDPQKTYLEFLQKYSDEVYLECKLIIAIKYGATAIVENLFNPHNFAGSFVSGCLRIAIPNEYLDIIQILIKSPNWDKYNMLSIAVETGNKDIVNLFLSKGALGYFYALDVTMQYGYLEIMEIILKSEKNLLDSNDHLQLFYKIIKDDHIHHCKNRNRNREMAKLLLASLEKIDRDIDPDFSARIIIYSWLGNEDVAHQLLNQYHFIYPPTTNKILIAAACGGLISVIERISGKVNVYGFGFIAAGAAVYGHIDIVQLCLDQGVCDYRTLKEKAKENGHQDIFDLVEQRDKQWRKE